MEHLICVSTFLKSVPRLLLKLLASMPTKLPFLLIPLPRWWLLSNQFSVSAKDLKDTFYKAIRIIKGYGPKLTRNFKTKPGRKSKAELEASQEA